MRSAVFTPVRAVVALPMLLAVLLYLPVQRNALLSDDHSLLYAFHGANGALELAGRVARTFVEGVGAPSSQYRPVAMATFALNVASGDADPLAWHLVNLALHAANAGLIAAVALRVGRGAPGNGTAALVAGVALAFFPPAVEAIAWPAARFDALALFFTLAAARFIAASERPLDRAAVAGLAAFALALGSKEAGVLALPLAGAIAWQKSAARNGLVRGAFAALPALLPWLAVAAGYFALRAAIFGDPFRFFPGATPMGEIASGAFIGRVGGVVAWWGRAFPESGASAVFAAAVALLAALAVAAAAREEARRIEFAPMLAAAAVAFAILGAQWQWPAHGEGGRVLYAPGAIALLALVVPLRSSVRVLRVAALVAAVALVLASAGLAHRAVERWVQAGSSMRALGDALAETAAKLPAGEYAFVLAGDHLGAVPFARNAQYSLLMPPFAPFALSSRVMVQAVPELPQWPGLFARDAVGRLMREPLIDMLRVPPPPARDPPYRLPDHFLCWDARERVLRPVALDLAPDAGNWDAAWARALASPACAQVQP